MDAKNLRQWLNRSVPPVYPVDAVAAQAPEPAPVPTLPARLRQFPGDIVIGASTDTTIDVTGIMGDKAYGFLLLSVIGSVQISINGQGLRSVPTAMSYDGINLQNLRILTGLASGCILQLNGL